MYTKFFDLNRQPFNVTPDPAFLYLSPSHKEAIGAIVYGIEQKKGFIAITGEVGVGKTTILRACLRNIDRSRLRLIYIFNTNLSFLKLLKVIFRELGLPVDTTEDVDSMVHALHQFLIDEYKDRNNVALVIDEAQNMPFETLENLRMLSNLETDEDKLIQVVLIGQPELQETLNRKELRQLGQRIAIRHEILPLSRYESLAYIRHRIAKAGGNAESVFTKSALNKIVKEADGIPRTINILCDNAMVAGYGFNKKPINSSIVREVIADFTGTEGSHKNRWIIAAAAIAILAVTAILLSPSSEPLLDYAKAAYVDFFSFHVRGDRVTDSVLTKDDPKQVVRSQLPAGEIKRRQTTSQPVKSKPAVKESRSGPQASTTESSEQQHPKPESMASKFEQAASGDSSPERPSLDNPEVMRQPMDGSSVAAKKGARAPEQNGTEASLQQPADHPPAADAPLASADAANPKPITRIVEKGDNLTRLIEEVYGVANDELIAWVRENNPRLRSINTLFVGTEIIFPPYPGKVELRDEISRH